jgi:hypothetical protein
LIILGANMIVKHTPPRCSRVGNRIDEKDENSRSPKATGGYPRRYPQGFPSGGW